MGMQNSVDASSKARPWRKYALRISIGVVLMLLGTVGVVYAVSEHHIEKMWQVEPITTPASTGPGAVERGRAVATFRGCRDCHGPDLAGRVFVDDMPVMRLVAPNITPAGVVADYTDEDWARTVRHGIKPDGRSVLFMPSYEWTALSHADMGDMLAYMKSVKPVADPVPAQSSIGPVGRALYLAEQLPLLPAEFIDHQTWPANPEPGPTAAYGSYLITGCTGCHGSSLSGGPIPGVPPDWPEAPNLTAHETGLADWTRDQFIETLRTGTTPSGETIRSEYMPWKFIAESPDDDLTAIWLYLRDVDPREFGNR